MTEGASFSEQLVDAARRNNLDLANQVIEKFSAEPEKLAEIINSAHDAIGDSPLHLASKYGSFEVLDLLLDQQGVEIDNGNKLDGSTPLHLAVEYCEKEPEHGLFIVQTLLEAGCDALTKNRSGLTPRDLVGSSKEFDSLRDELESSEFAAKFAAQPIEQQGEEVEDESSDDEEIA